MDFDDWASTTSKRSAGYHFRVSWRRLNCGSTGQIEFIVISFCHGHKLSCLNSALLKNSVPGIGNHGRQIQMVEKKEEKGKR